MLSRIVIPRAAKSLVPAIPLHARALSTTLPALNARVPSLSDITEQSTADYKSRVEAYREAQRAALEAEREALRHETSANAPSSPVRRALDAIIHGSEEGKIEEKLVEQSHSKLLARGKYIHEIVVHNVKPEFVEEYTQIVGQEYPRIISDEGNEVHLVGSWKAGISDPDTFIHIWEYQGYSGYHSTLARLASQPQHQKYLKEVPKYLRSRTHDLMQEFNFWPTSPPRHLGGIFELRSYTLQPGKLLEWESNWKRGLEARRSVMEPAGAWFTQIGHLNMVHYMWQFKDLRDREEMRHKSWSQPGWSDTVHKTVPLIKKMETRILVPMDWSPLR